MSSEFEISGIKYRTKAMDARRQFHVATKLAGVAAGFNADNPMGALAGLTPDDSDFVINECLRVVERQNEGATGWSDVMAPTGQIMFEDVRTSMAALLQLVIPVIRENVQAFLSELPKDFLPSLLAGIAKPSA